MVQYRQADRTADIDFTFIINLPSNNPAYIAALQEEIATLIIRIKSEIGYIFSRIIDNVLIPNSRNSFIRQLDLDTGRKWAPLKRITRERITRYDDKLTKIFKNPYVEPIQRNRYERGLDFIARGERERIQRGRILRDTELLFRSIGNISTSLRDRGGISRKIEKHNRPNNVSIGKKYSSLYWGTAVPYSGYHHYGVRRKNLPARRFIPTSQKNVDLKVAYEIERLIMRNLKFIQVQISFGPRLTKD